MKKLIVIWFIAASVMQAQNEFIVNSYQDSTQREPVIARSASGSYVIAWQSENQASINSQGDIYFQWFDSNDQPLGNETLVNSNIGFEQERPAVAMNNLNDFIIVWASHTGDSDDIFDISAVIYRGPISSQIHTDEFKVNTTTIHSQTKPAVDINESGESIVVWESWYQDGSDRGIYGQMLDAEGEKVGNEFLINTTIAYSQSKPIVKYFSNGNFIVVWESWKQDIATPSGYGLYGKIFDSNGAVVKDEFQINTYTNDYQWFGDVDTYDDGRFVVVWCSWEQDGHDGGIYIQKFDADGNKTGSEKKVNQTTVYYQWLPKVKIMPNQNIAIVWSSWLQDGDREGVYCIIMDSELNKVSFETQVNEYTNSYQWEPDFVVTDENQLLVTWASWGQTNNDYEILARRLKPVEPQAVIATKSYLHNEGNSTSRFFVHVIDSTQLTGDTYELSFSVTEDDKAYADIRNVSKSLDVITDFPIDKGEGIFYLTNTFDGVSVEFNPVFNFKIDTENSYFVNNSGTNITFTVGAGLGASELAPIDVAVIWGSTDTLADGSYAQVLDNAYNQTGQKVVGCPFLAWNITDGEKMDLVVIEPSASSNLRWDVNEQIGILTPPQYATNFPRYHASLVPTYSGELQLPGIGDTNFVFTKRPITDDDKFTFTTNKSLITTDARTILNPIEFELQQNYPNPFNSSTTIKFAITPPLSQRKKVSDLSGESRFIGMKTEGRVRILLKVFDILGREITTLVNETKSPGIYSVEFNASQLASGVYFYKLQTENGFSAIKKLVLIK